MRNQTQSNSPLGYLIQMVILDTIGTIMIVLGVTTLWDVTIPFLDYFPWLQSQLEQSDTDTAFIIGGIVLLCYSFIPAFKLIRSLMWN